MSKYAGEIASWVNDGTNFCAICGCSDAKPNSKCSGKCVCHKATVKIE